MGRGHARRWPLRLFWLLRALGVLGLVAFREHVGFIELASRAAHKWFTFWNWLGLGAGTHLAQGHTAWDAWDRLLSLLPHSGDRNIFLVGTLQEKE